MGTMAWLKKIFMPLEQIYRKYQICIE